MKFSTSSLFFAILFISLGCSTAQSTGGKSSSFNPRDLLQAVNRVRSKGCKCGGTTMPPVKPLKWNDRLESATQSHSNYMNSRRKLSHTGNRNSNPGSRITATGYKWNFYAENIAMGQQTVDEVMYSWLKSTGHCKNIMNRKATEMGAAKSGVYWTQVFANPQ